MKLPRDISGSKAIKALKRLGFEIMRQEGSHIRLAKSNVRITVPNHKTIAPKTLQTILRQAGITLEQFLDVL